MTRPLRFNGSKLLLNVNAKGSVKVAITDNNAKAIPGFDFDDCRPVKGDSLNRIVNFTGGSLKRLSGEVVRVKFKLRNAKLYAMKFE